MMDVFLDVNAAKKLVEILDSEIELAEEFQSSKKARDDLRQLEILREHLNSALSEYMYFLFNHGCVDQALTRFPFDVAVDLACELKKELGLVSPDSDASKLREELNHTLRVAICRAALGKRFWRQRKKHRGRPDLQLES